MNHLVDNLRTLSSESGADFSHFRVVQDGEEESIVRNGFLMGMLLAPWQGENTERVRRVAEGSIRKAKEQLIALGEGPERSRLFTAAQVFNRVFGQKGGAQELLITLPEDHPETRELTPVTHVEMEPLAVIDGASSQVIHQQYVPAWGSFFRTSLLPRHRDDCDLLGHPIDHSHEAFHIFVSTQIERLLSLIGKVCESVSRLFGFEITYFKQFHYDQGGLNPLLQQPPTIPLMDRPLLPGRVPAPTSHWLGHASLFLNIPLRALNGDEVASFNVITDPVEEDLQQILYPRQTPFATPMEELPPTDVFLLSHNHLDHFSSATIAKLLNQQPVMLVPVGDGAWFQAQGFTHVRELNWWEGVNLTFTRGESQFQMEIRGVPTRHWAGQGPAGGHESGALGYVIRGNPNGDLLFSGDTARITEEELELLARAYPNLKWIFEPGGPDEDREDMQTTHQASVDALWKTVELLLKPLANRSNSLEEFLEEAAECKTVLMHTMTFKLGRLHLDDTPKSIAKVLAALEEGIDREQLAVYETRVLNELLLFCNHLARFDLPPQVLANLLREIVVVPKIGSTLDLIRSKREQANLAFDGFFTRPAMPF